MGLKVKRSLPGLGVVRSAAISMRHVFERKLTVQYPDEAPAVGFRFRGRHIFHQDVCIGCTQCERVCPVIAIKMETHKDPTSRKVVTDRFALDLGICYYCGLCEEVCPTDPKAVHLGPDFELATHDRRLLIYEMDQLVGPKPLPSRPKPAAAAAGGAPAAAAGGAQAARPASPAAPAEGAAPPADKPSGEVKAAEQPPLPPAPGPRVNPVAEPETVPDEPAGKPPAAPSDVVRPPSQAEKVGDEPNGEDPASKQGA
jgi:NADH-quinone oxidoreductase subunit I